MNRVQDMITLEPGSPVSPEALAAFAVTDMRAHRDGEGNFVLRNALPLPSPVPDMIDRLDHWATARGDSVLISEPAATGRRSLTYADAADASRAVAARLRALAPTSGGTVCVVASAGCDHAVIKLACLRANLVHAPLSPSFVNTESGMAKLAGMIKVCRPSLILVETDLLEPVRSSEIGTIAPVETMASMLTDGEADSAVAGETTDPASPNDTAAIYFTSGSTGDAKGVRITRGMISAVHAAIAVHWPFLTREAPVMVDWLPWHHVFGGLDNFFKMVWNGGAYHVRPAPSRDTIDQAVSLIASVRPTLYVDVPFGIKLLLDSLENSVSERTDFFSRLELIFFAGAGMDAKTWGHMNRLILKSRDDTRASLRIASGYGSTEAASTICLAHEEPGSPGEIGLPLPGHTLRLVDVEGRTEVRVKGPCVSPGYITADGDVGMPLDEQGFLCTGDVVAPVRPMHPELGLRFDGRLAEDFKLTSGTRVRVGALRQMLLAACAPYLADVAIAGETREYLGVLLFPTAAALAEEREHLTGVFEKALSGHNDQWPASSMAIRRAILMDGPPDPDAGEINDKGHLVQRRCLTNRAAAIDRLYAKRPDADVMVVAMPAV